MIYPHRPDLAHKKFWACIRFPNCDAYVGCHRTTNKPLGRLANKELRVAKSAAHAAFDPIWQQNTEDRNRRRHGYLWLAKELEIEYALCHIGMMDVETCRQVVKICQTKVCR